MTGVAAASPIVKIDGNAGQHGRAYREQDIEVLAKWPGIIQLDLPRGVVPAGQDRWTLQVSSWPQAALEGLTWTPEGSERDQELQRRNDVSVRFDSNTEMMWIELTGESLRGLATGGRLQLIDHYR